MRRLVVILVPIVACVFCAGIATAAKVASFHPVRAGRVLRAPKRFEGHRVRAYQWERCGRRGRACRKVHGATHRTYRVRKADINHAFRVQLTVAVGQGSVTVVSAPTAVITGATPVNLTLPIVTGTALQGDVLTGTQGTWQNATSFADQWEDCDASGANCVAIAGATSLTYTIQASDVGHTIRLAVTATNTTADSAA